MGATKGASTSMGLVSLANGPGFSGPVPRHADGAAAVGSCRRRGLGRHRHLATADLWIQEKVRSGQVELLKILGKDNPADVFTKYVDKTPMEAAMSKLSLVFESGRSAIAPEIMGKSETASSAVEDRSKQTLATELKVRSLTFFCKQFGRPCK